MDTYAVTLEIASPPAATVTLARTAGTDCDEIELVYTTDHFRKRGGTRLYLDATLSTIPEGMCPGYWIDICPGAEPA